MQFSTIITVCLFTGLASASFVQCNHHLLYNGRHWGTIRKKAGWAVRFYEEKPGQPKRLVAICKNASPVHCNYLKCTNLAAGFSAGTSTDVLSSGTVGSIGNDPQAQRQYGVLLFVFCIFGWNSEYLPVVC